MPGFDRTGPMGQGPMTGGGFGRCGNRRNLDDVPQDRGLGRRLRRGRGPGFGRGRRLSEDEANWGSRRQRGNTAGSRRLQL